MHVVSLVVKITSGGDDAEPVFLSESFGYILAVEGSILPWFGRECSIGNQFDDGYWQFRCDTRVTSAGSSFTSCLFGYLSFYPDCLWTWFGSSPRCNPATDGSQFQAYRGLALLHLS